MGKVYTQRLTITLLGVIILLFKICFQNTVDALGQWKVKADVLDE